MLPKRSAVGPKHDAVDGFLLTVCMVRTAPGRGLPRRRISFYRRVTSQPRAKQQLARRVGTLDRRRASKLPCSARRSAVNLARRIRGYIQWFGAPQTHANGFGTCARGRADSLCYSPGQRRQSVSGVYDGMAAHRMWPKPSQCRHFHRSYM